MWKHAVVGAALVLGAGQAGAATMRAEITGEVLSPFDLNDVLFGGALNDGETFKLTYLYDTEVGEETASGGPPPSPESKSRSGGSVIGTSSPVSAILEIAGVVFNIGGDYLGSVFLSENNGDLGFFDSVGYSARDFACDLVRCMDLTIDFTVLDAVDPTTDLPFGFEDEFEFVFDDLGGNFANGSFFAAAYPLGATNIDEYEYYAQMQLELDSIVVTNLSDGGPVDPVDPPPSAVPLPASSLLLLAGLAGLAALRRPT